MRAGLGIALLAAGADGLRRIEDGPLEQTLTARPWLPPPVGTPTSETPFAVPCGPPSSVPPPTIVRATPPIRAETAA